MVRLAHLKDRRTVNVQGTATLLVKQAGSEMAHALERGLRATGLPLTVLANPYDAVTEAATGDAPVEYLVVGVDFFDAEAFRLIPLFRREWPDTTVVAYHSPGFEHKGRIAQLVGADVVVSRPAQLLDLLATLSRQTPPTAAPRPAAARAGDAPAPSAAPSQTPSRDAAAEPPPAPRPPEPSRAPEPAEAPRATVPPPPVEERGPREHSPTPAEAKQTEPASPAPALDETENLDHDEELSQGRVIGTIELTDEELRILLGEDEDT
jgi:hypothetical protein